jgi:glycosyltransferase involved in cell wall biosynthesis
VRVVHIGKFDPSTYGGIETHLRVLAPGLSRYIDVRLLVANDSRISEESSVCGVPVLRAGTLFRFASTPFCPAMIPATRSGGADVLHLHLPNPAAILVYLASNHRGPLVISYHSDTYRHKILARLFEPFLLKALRRCDAIVASSQSYVDNSPILARFKDRCHIIPYGISTSGFERCDPAAIRAIRESHGDRIVLAVGRLVYYKGFEYLVRAMRNIDAKLLILGEGPMLGALQREIAECGVGSRVAILGGIGDLAPYYHAADVFALPSICRTEAFGIVQLEAMACGTPVVNTFLPTSVPSVSLSGVTGLTVPPAESEALATAINLLLDNPELRLRYGHAAKRRVDEEFGEELMTERTLQLYRDVLKQPLAHPSKFVPAETEEGAP